jgi:uncharacterized protein (DUF1684 family)
MENSSWKEYLKKERERKDIFFQVHPQSPIPTIERRGFKGLDYYPPNPKYRFELELHEHSEKTRVRMTYTDGEKKEFLRHGEFRFKIEGIEQVLSVYKSSSGAEQLFIPFRDATSGKDTYSAGRYIDLQPETHLTAEEKWILDFNRAYNPWCAYSEKYTCPFVPPENWLETPIPAGEKQYKAHQKRSATHG